VAVEAAQQAQRLWFHPTASTCSTNQGATL
jgi:hypothetical protein